jgi:FMN phosphatase YigB (HAD superfamily)
MPRNRRPKLRDSWIELKNGDLSFATVSVRPVPDRHGEPRLLNRSGLRFNYGLVSVDRDYAAIVRAAGETLMDGKKVVFLVDVDNTLLDNDHVIADLMRHLEREVGQDRQQRYWTLFEQLRSELGYADYLGALQRYRLEYPRDPHLLTVSSFLVNYPFANRLFPNSLDVLEYIKQAGPAVILSDGDVVFQPRKVERSGLFEAVDGNVLIYVHKEQELEDVEERYAAQRYVLIDDKLRILAAIKRLWGDRVTTVQPLQGHYAKDASEQSKYPKADITIGRIGELVDYDLARLTGGL